MSNNSYYYGLREETTAGTPVKPWPRPCVVKERPSKPSRWQGIARLFRRKARSYHAALLAQKSIIYPFDTRTASGASKSLNAYLLSDDMIARCEEEE